MARTVQLAPGVLRIPTAPANGINSFAFVEDDGTVTLVDAGLKGAPRKIEAALAEVGKAPADVARILLTHAHTDHAGGARALKERTGGRLSAHEHEARYLRDGLHPPIDEGTVVGRVLAYAVRGAAPVGVDETFSDGQLLDVGGGLRVVHTPGHTPGHVSFLHERSGTLITGDAIFNVRGLTYSPAFFCSDVPVSRETAARLGGLDYEVAAFTHGREIRENAREAVRAFLRRRRTV